MFQSTLEELRTEYPAHASSLDFAFEFVNKDHESFRFPLHRELILLNRYLRWCLMERPGFARSDSVMIDANDFFCGDLMEPKDIELLVRTFYGCVNPGLDYRQHLVQMELALRLHCYPLVLTHGEKLRSKAPVPEYANHAFKLLAAYIQQPELMTRDEISTCTKRLGDVVPLFQTLMKHIIENMRGLLHADYAACEPGAMEEAQFRVASMCCDDLIVAVVSDPMFPAGLMGLSDLIRLHGFGRQVLNTDVVTFVVNMDAVLSQYIFEYAVVVGRHTEVSRIYRRLVTASLDYTGLTMSRSVRILRVLPSDTPPEVPRARRRVAYINWPKTCPLPRADQVPVAEIVWIDRLRLKCTLNYLDESRYPIKGCMFPLVFPPGSLEPKRELRSGGPEPIGIAEWTPTRSPRISLVFMEQEAVCSMMYFSEVREEGEEKK